MPTGRSLLAVNLGREPVGCPAPVVPAWAPPTSVLGRRWNFSGRAGRARRTPPPCRAAARPGLAASSPQGAGEAVRRVRAPAAPSPARAPLTFGRGAPGRGGRRETRTESQSVNRLRSPPGSAADVPCAPPCLPATPLWRGARHGVSARPSAPHPLPRSGRVRLCPVVGELRPRPRALLVCARACVCSAMILTQVHLRKPCYDFYFLEVIKFVSLPPRGATGEPAACRSASASLTKPLNR